MYGGVISSILLRMTANDCRGQRKIVENGGHENFRQILVDNCGQLQRTVDNCGQRRTKHSLPQFAADNGGFWQTSHLA